MTPSLPLAGRGIVITRPARQAAVLAETVRGYGGRPILFPVIEIHDIDDRRALDALIDAIDSFDIVVFVSPNAVDKGTEAIRARRELPTTLKAAAIGRGTARALRKAGFDAVVAPATGADSESLLNLPELTDVAGKRIAIFRGAGGRELLSDTLKARGAKVEYAECYVRAKPKADTEPLERGWERGEVDGVVVTSSEGLRNFCELLSEDARLRLARTPVFVPHPRIAATARELGLEEVILTGTGDEGISSGLAAHFSSSR